MAEPQNHALAENTPAAAHSAAPIPDFFGIWSHPSFPGFEPPASGPGPVVNKSRRPQVNFDGRILPADCVQKAAGHRDPGTSKLYDRGGYNPEKAASFFATTDLSGLTAARLRARRFDFVVSPEPPTLAAHHTIFWEIRA
jgi:hypothetical protein